MTEEVAKAFKMVGIPLGIVVIAAALLFMYKTYLDITYTRLEIHRLQKEHDDETGKFDLPILRKLI